LPRRPGARGDQAPVVAKLTAPHNPLTLVDGAATDFIRCSDRGLAYGDGLFETLPLIDGEPQHWERHFRRLSHSAARLFIECPTEAEFLADIAAANARRAPSPRAVLKIILTRGSGGRSYGPPEQACPVRIVQIFDWPPARTAAEPFTAIVCAIHLGANPALAGVKHLNRLEQVLGAREVAEAGVDEGLMLDPDDQVVAGTRSNVFGVRDGVLFTPRLDRAGIAGVMREVVIEHCRRSGQRVVERALTLHELQTCAEIFFTNSIRGLQSLACLRLDDRQLAFESHWVDRLRDELMQARRLP